MSAGRVKRAKWGDVEETHEKKQAKATDKEREWADAFGLPVARRRWKWKKREKKSRRETGAKKEEKFYLDPTGVPFFYVRCLRFLGEPSPLVPPRSRSSIRRFLSKLLNLPRFLCFLSFILSFGQVSACPFLPHPSSMQLSADRWLPPLWLF